MRHKIILKIGLILLISLLFVAPTTALSYIEKSRPNFHSTSIISYDTHKSTLNPKINAIMNQINRSLILNYLIPIVSYGPRLTGTYGCEKTAQYIYDQFKSLNLQIQQHNWTSFHTGHNLRNLKPRILSSQNIEGILPGTDPDSEKIIIFNAHYDTTKFSPGADDDGSGTAAVLAAAYVLSQFSFNHTIRFVTFSGEEQGLYGSHAYAKKAYEKNEDIIVALNADMIGNAENKNDQQFFRIYPTKDVAWIRDEIYSLNNYTGLDFSFYTNIMGERSGGSDYLSFMEYGYEILAFFEGNWSHDMHSTQDTIENLDVDYLVNTTRLIATTIAYLADADITHPAVSIESPRKGHLYFEGKEKRPVNSLKTIVFDDIWIWADVTEGDAPILKVEFFWDEKLKFTDTEYPYKWQCNERSLRTHTISVVITDEQGRTAETWTDIFLFNPRTRR
jgi:aminopeptidase YwaD